MHATNVQASTRNGTVLEGLWSTDGVLDVAKLRLLSRTYPVAVAGATRTVSFDPVSAAFLLSFAANPAITAPTIVFLNRKLFYPRGATVAVSPAGSLTWRQGAMAHYLEFSFAGGVASGQAINITIVPQ